jgi:hypothetical protein
MHATYRIKGGLLRSPCSADGGVISLSIGLSGCMCSVRWSVQHGFEVLMKYAMQIGLEEISKNGNVDYIMPICMAVKYI